MKFKFDLKDKKTNIIFTSIILALAIAITAITGVQFRQFSKFQTQFYTQDVDEVLHFSQFSPSLKGTVGDSEIYVKYGNQNTVLVAKPDKASAYQTKESLSGAKIVGIDGSTQLAAAINSGLTVETKPSAHQAILALDSGADVAVLSYGEARTGINSGAIKVLPIEVEKVPSILVMGGTHPNEPSGQMTAIMFLENAVVERGILYVMTEVNKSAYTHSQPQEATTWYYDLETKSGGTRTFKFGSRATNTNEQWPNPDVYVHSSGQSLSSSEVRNINRAYPGSPTGNYTERVAFAVAEFIRQKDVTIVVDLHEASPEYITINAIIYHQDSDGIAGQAVSGLSGSMESYTAETKNGVEIDGVEITPQESPKTMHGLTHRELGDYTNAYVFLLETSNASQGKYRGAFTESLITYYKTDKFYEFAASVDQNKGTQLLYARPVSLDERVARHALTIECIINAYNKKGVSRKVVQTAESRQDQVGKGGDVLGKLIINNMPEYVDYIDNGVGYYLKDLA